MRKRFLSAKVSAIVLVLTIMAGAAIFGPNARADDKGKHGPIPWIESLPDGLKSAKKDKKIVFVDFWAEWCVPCKRMLKTTYIDPKVVARARKFVPVLLDLDKVKDAAAKYKIEAIPVVLFLDANGNVLVRGDGYKDAAKMLKLMGEALKKAK
jgi:thiol:disulfide interchange protein